MLQIHKIQTKDYHLSIYFSVSKIEQKTVKSSLKVTDCSSKEEKIHFIGSQINDNCQREMLIHRRMLMSDYMISTKFGEKCHNEMIQHCAPLYQQGASGTIDQRSGRMIHCLLKAAQQEKNFSSECLSNVKSLIRAVNPGSDIRADPLLEATCRPVIDALCSKMKPGDSNIIMCLLNNLKSNRMTDECEDRLMEVSYFMVRDWR